MFTPANLTALFASLAELPSTNENESRLNNTTKAEVFAGVLRAFRKHAAVHGPNPGAYFLCFSTNLSREKCG